MGLAAKTMPVIEYPDIQLVKKQETRVSVHSKNDSFLIFPFASCFQQWFNFCSYLLLVPFRIRQNGEKYYSSHNSIHRILCGIVQSLATIGGIFQIRGMLADNKDNNPVMIAQVVERIISICYCAVFYYLVWFKENNLLVIFNKANPYRSTMMVQIKVTLLCWFVLFSSGIGYFAYELSYIYTAESVYKGLVRHANKTHFEIGLHTDQNFSTPYWVAVGGISVFLKLHKYLLLDFVSSLTALTSFVTLKICTEFKYLMLQFEDDEILINEAFAGTKNFFQKINCFFGPLFVCVFSSIICTFSLQITTFIFVDHGAVRAQIAYYMLLTSSMLIMSSEAHHRANHYKTWLLNRRKGDLGISRIFDYLEADYNSAALAIHGDRFFTITYTFLGTAIGILLTYSVIIIQFQFGGAKINFLYEQ